MYNVPESECFTAKYRAVLRGEEIKLFTPNDSISLYSQVNFDNQSLQKSAVDYFAVSILGGILSSVKAHFCSTTCRYCRNGRKNLAQPRQSFNLTGRSRL
ncbi:TPA: hypothetical protein ACPJNL_000266 [Haemophilus influenzae]|uniref:hypothetical protein n=1 Tax=Haemophilus influenzae TaxID=727 RepID=UPI0034D9DE3A|nr:hypothetical protein [Haemophilus influenzae]MCK8910259.1 hypothetical protein [Haemophilus influenzae]